MLTITTDVYGKDQILKIVHGGMRVDDEAQGLCVSPRLSAQGSKTLQSEEENDETLHSTSVYVQEGTLPKDPFPDEPLSPSFSKDPNDLLVFPDTPIIHRPSDTISLFQPSHDISGLECLEDFDLNAL